MDDDDNGELEAWFDNLPDKLRKELSGELNTQADGLVDAIQAEAAEGETGKLKQSVRKSPGRHDLEVIVEAGGPLTTKEVRAGSGIGYDYALGSEFGNEHVPAQPFFFSTYEARREDIEQALQDKAEDVLSRA